MGERKVLNKYIPYDFDPTKIPRSKRPKDNVVPVRMMLPFTIQCQTCSAFLYRGRKYNSKKENCKGEKATYLGIQRFRFYLKCSVCSRPITFLTDPEKTDYEMESGATRCYEVHKDKSKTNEEIAAEKEHEEEIDPMKALENRVLDSQREMAELDALEELRALNKRHARMRGGMGEVKYVLEARERMMQLAKLCEEEGCEIQLNEFGLTEEEEMLVSTIKFGKDHPEMGTSNIRRLNDEDEAEEDLRRKRRAKDAERMMQSLQRKQTQTAPIVMMRKKKKRKKPPPAADGTHAVKPPTANAVSQDVSSTASSSKPTSSSNGTINSHSPPPTKQSLGTLLGYGSSSSSSNE
mmetsp:Transcript_61883/g.74462  ORF Transcript_61883/g.74462 Transcript_61883/m.74462 type:complete len:350 (-) Transcript_61883:45-1094(-)